MCSRRSATATGQRPRGWLGTGLTQTHNTLDILAEEGVTYCGDWNNDDQPYRMKVKSGKMIAIPYCMEINDIPLFIRKGYTGEQYYRSVMDQFEGLLADSDKHARVMGIPLHPMIIGQPLRTKYLQRALAEMKKHDQVWFATGSEIIDAYEKAQPGRVARLSSARPVRRLVHDAAADHGHQRRDAGDAALLDRQRIGAEHGEVGKLAGLQACPSCPRRTSDRRHRRSRSAAPPCGVSACSRRDPLLGHVAGARDRLRDRQEVRDRHVVGRQRHLHAGIEQAAQRHDLAVTLRRQPLGVHVQALVEIVVGVGGEHQTHAHDALDVRAARSR